MKLVVSTTSVLPSQWPTASPFTIRTLAGSVRTPIGGNDAHVVNLFAQQRHNPGRLYDLIVGVVVGRNHGRSGVPDRYATLVRGPVFRTIEFMSSGGGSLVGHTLLSLRRQRRKLALRRIEYHGGSHVRGELPTVPPELVIVAHTLEFVAIHPIQLFLGVLSRFLGSEKLVLGAGALSGPLERRQSSAVPHTLKIRLAVRSAGCRPRFRCGRFRYGRFLRRVRLGLSGSGEYRQGSASAPNQCKN